MDQAKLARMQASVRIGMFSFLFHSCAVLGVGAAGLMGSEK